MKKAVGIMITILLLLCMAESTAESFLPTISDVYGVEMPSFRTIVYRTADEKELSEDGTLYLKFLHVNDNQYDQWNKYLKDSGCTLVHYTNDDERVNATIARNGGEMHFLYDSEAQLMVIEYCKGSVEESAYQVGNIIAFGRYEQDNDFSNGYENIEWVITDVKSDRILLVSKYGLDYGIRNVTKWENSESREWLNNIFYNLAFCEEEQEAIILSDVDNSLGQTSEKWTWMTEDENNTKDKVFLLSYNEFFSKYASVKEIRECNETAYARAVAINCYYSVRGLEGTFSKNEYWLLRNGGAFGIVSCDGTEPKNGYRMAYMRPAVWIDIDAFEAMDTNTRLDERYSQELRYDGIYCASDGSSKGNCLYIRFFENGECYRAWLNDPLDEVKKYDKSKFDKFEYSFDDNILEIKEGLRSIDRALVKLDGSIILSHSSDIYQLFFYPFD